MGKSFKHFYEFGPFRLDAGERLLLRDGKPVPLPPKDFEMLLVLVENGGRVLEKGELLRRVWPDSFVEEANLSHHVFTLRKALGEEGDGSKYIETVPRRGYRFVADVNVVRDESADPAAEGRNGTGITTQEGKEKVTASSHAEAGGEAATTIPPTSPFVGSRVRRSLPVILIACAVAAGLGIAAYFWLKGRTQPAGETAVIRSIAVLPFKPLVAEGRDESLELGMADALITRLSNLHNIVVRPTSTVRRYSDLGQDPLAAGRELGVEAILEGSIQRLDGRVRVTVRLVSVRDGSSLWADRFDQTFTDIFKIQDAISEQVAQALRLELTRAERNLLSRHDTESSEAHQSYMMGRYHWSRSNPEGWVKAVEYFNRAVEQDPNYALAYTGLADAYVSLAFDVLPQMEAVLKAKESALRALELDSTLAEAHVSLGKIKAYFEWAWEDAEREFKRAIELNPNSANSYREYGLYLSCLGRNAEAIRETEQARGLDPFSLSTNFAVGWALIGARRYDEAIEQFHRALEIDPRFAQAHLFAGLAYEGKGMWEEAIREMQKAASLSGDSMLIRAQLGHAYASSGRRGEAERILAELLESSRQRRVSPYYIAMVYAGLDDRDQAFAWLEKAYAERSRRLWALRVVPTWENLRSDSRFADLLRRMGLPQ